jgi:hypothetical protein
MINLELDVCWLSDEQELLKETTNKEIPISESSFKKHTFYTVDSVFPDDDKNFSGIWSGGECFMAKINIETLKTRIQEQLTFKYN